MIEKEEKKPEPVKVNLGGGMFGDDSSSDDSSDDSSDESWSSQKWWRINEQYTICSIDLMRMMILY